MDKNKIEDLLNRYLETDVFKMTMKFLVEKNLISSNKYKFKDTLRRIWFSNQYLKIFERFDMKYKNWIYFAKEEEQKKIDYRGYIKNIKLADVSNDKLTVFDNLFNLLIYYVFIPFICRRGKLSSYVSIYET